jgi:excinuclease UvrABC nuclease subunit
MSLIKPAEESNYPVPDEILRLKSLQCIDVSSLRVVSGVYFLCYADTVVYVGQSINVISRLMTHITSDEKQFDSAFYIPVPEHQLASVELAFIRSLAPIYNAKVKAATKGD